MFMIVAKILPTYVGYDIVITILTMCNLPMKMGARDSKGS